MTTIFLLVLISLAVIVLVRNNLTSRWMRRALDEVHVYNMRLINQGRTSELLDYESNLPSYESVLFDPIHWTYETAVRRHVRGI